MNAYEAKQEARRERLEARADRLERESHGAYRQAMGCLDGIEPGQPILVGHHSEKRHRRALDRHDGAMRKSIDAQNAAGEARAKAASVGTGGISSDDPDAIAKLQKQLAKCEAFQAKAKEYNRLVRAGRKLHGGDGAKVAEYLRSKGVDDTTAAALAKPDFCGRWGVPDYALTNNNANMRRIRQRIATLEAQHAAAAETPLTRETIGDIEIVCDAEENRVRLLFPGKPSAEIRAELKRNGFRWAPSEGAWQRQLGRYAVDEARRIAKKACA